MPDIPDLHLPNSLSCATSHIRITGQVSGWVSAALARHAPLDSIGWDVALQIVPAQQGPQPAVVVLLQMASPIIGNNIVQMIMVQWGDLTAPNIDTAVSQGVATLHQQRATVLNGNGQLGGATP